MTDNSPMIPMINAGDKIQLFPWQIFTNYNQPETQHL